MSRHGRIEVGTDGFPMLRMPQRLADEPVKPPSPPASDQPGYQAGSSEIDRRRDAVREAAREFESLADQDIRERLKGVTNRPLTEAEVASFTADVATQVLDDLVDALDQRLRGRKRRRRTVRLNAPNGYVRKCLNDRTDEELSSLAHRLVARGWMIVQVRDHLVRHLMPDRVDRVAPEKAPRPETPSTITT